MTQCAQKDSGTEGQVFIYGRGHSDSVHHNEAGRWASESSRSLLFAYVEVVLQLRRGDAWRLVDALIPIFQVDEFEIRTFPDMLNTQKDCA